MRRAAVRIAALAGALVLGGASPRPQLPVTDHFDGLVFHNEEPSTVGFQDWLKRELTAHRGRWRRFTDTPPGPRPPERVEGAGLRVTFVNHSTFLIQTDGWNILTDPTWAPRTVPGVGRRRRRPPGICFEDLPPIDVVLVSHNHHDHMDLETLRRLARERHPEIFTGLGNARFLARERIPFAHDLDWWQSVVLAPGVTLTAVPARHMSGRDLVDQNRTLWCGFVITTASGSIYFAGDTGWGGHFARIGAAFPDIRLAMLPIGSFKPVWYMREQHMGPDDLAAAHRALGARTSVPMHFGTFPAGDESETEPVDLLKKALAAAPDVAPHVVILDNGQPLEVAPLPPNRAGAQ
jgi:L-ascorbate metabolism protein UlaG (beta-lactamase superfamily)